MSLVNRNISVLVKMSFKLILYHTLAMFIFCQCVNCEEQQIVQDFTNSSSSHSAYNIVNGYNTNTGEEENYPKETSSLENVISIFPSSTTLKPPEVSAQTQNTPTLINLIQENQPEYISQSAEDANENSRNSKNLRLIKFLRHFRLDFSKFDTTCLRRSGRGLPAPQVVNGHVLKYSRRRNKNGPRNRYAMALFECDDDYEFPPESADRMFCSRNKWVGPTPVCLPKRTFQETECLKCEQICTEESDMTSVICSCYSGYEMINDTCVDVDECQVNNGGCFAICFNTPGSYQCSCPSGFTTGPDGKSCIDKNECLLRNGHGPCQDKCTNVPGSYVCSCERIAGTRLAEDKHSCEDINECLEGDNFGCSHTCLNTFGNAFCACPKGYFLSTENYKTCISEEREDTESDEEYSVPQNLIEPEPPFECPPGSSPDTENNRICVEHEDCSIDNGGCEQICLPSGSFRLCSCKEGYKLVNETSCIDVNECELENGGCDQICVNIPGSFHCTCKKGFFLEDDRKTCTAKYCEEAPFIQNTSGWECESSSEEKKLSSSEDNGNSNSLSYVIGTKCKLRCSPGYSMKDFVSSNVIHQQQQFHQHRHQDHRAYYNSLYYGYVNSQPSSSNEIEPFGTVKGINGKMENKAIVCSYDGTWSPPPQRLKSPCALASCTKLSHPKDGSLFPDICLQDNVPLNTQCLIICSPGYYPKNGRIRTCSKGLRWFPEDNPICIRLPPTPRPYIHCPSDVIVNLKPGQSSGYVKIPQPQANMDWYRYVEADPPWAKSLEWNVPAGITHVTFTARSPISNDTATCQFKIHVVDREPPKVQGCPTSFEIRLNSGESSREIWWSEPKFTDNVKVHSVQNSHSPGIHLSRGNHYITYLAGDAEGNKARCTFTITIHVGPEDYEMADYSYYSSGSNGNGNVNIGNNNDLMDSPMNSYHHHHRQVVICPNLKTGKWALHYVHYLPPGCRYHSQALFSKLYKQNTFQHLTSRLRRRVRRLHSNSNSNSNGNIINDNVKTS